MTTDPADGLSPAAKAELQAAIAIIREDRFGKYARTVLKRVPKEEPEPPKPTDPPEPPKPTDPPTPPTPPTPPPPKPTDPPPNPEPPKKRRLKWWPDPEED